MARAFVIHKHSTPGGVHYDLMLEAGDALATWQFGVCPTTAELPLPCRRIGDHRKAYLTYEGEVSGGRGRVELADAGTYELLEELPDSWAVRFGGRGLVGPCLLRRDCAGGDAWTLQSSADSGHGRKEVPQ